MSKYILNFIIFFVIAAVGVVIYQQYFSEIEEPEGAGLVLEIPESTEGLDIEILETGEGEGAKDGDEVTVDYTGWLEDGTKFDSSVDKGVPFSFQLGAGRVIRGWDLGVLGMKVGEKRKLTIAPELGYGEAGNASIPPNSTLIFEVEMLQIN